MSRLRFQVLCVFALALTALSCSAADRVVFLRIAPTQSTLFISNADGTGERPLIQPGNLDYNPAWSPTGDWIAFTSERAGSADIFRVHPDGSGLERLTDSAAFDDQAAFSPDGRQVVFVSTRATGFANLWILDAATHKARPLTAGKDGDFRPAWSPDGQWIAFSSDRGSDLPTAKGRWERLHLVDIYLIHPDGSGLKRISQHGNFCGSPKWTPDSKSVVTHCMSAEQTWEYRTAMLRGFPADGESQIFQIDIASGSAKPVTSGLGVKLAPAVLSSGKIAYVNGNQTGVSIVYPGGEAGPTGQGLSPNPPAWSPDASHVVYSRTSYHPSPEPVELWSRNPKFDLYATTELPAYDPSGEHLAVTKAVFGGITSLMIVDEGKPAHPILDRKDLVLGSQWSPDGKRIVVGVGEFSSFLNFDVGTKTPIDRFNGGAQVAILNADGTGFHVVTSGPNNNAFATFAPDGKRIIYRTAGPDGQGLRIMNLEDHSIKTLTSEYDNFPLWSPRGDLIAFVRNINGDFEVMTMRPDGSDVKQLTHTHGNEAHLAWSPDGERLLFTSSRMRFKDEALYTGSPQPYGDIFVMNYDGSHVEQLTDDQWEEGGPAWQPHKP
ncbi:MAG: PD40 domain-containing protein [Acidobacteriota bacterium]|nr:PD40 domain-containing protein [Acidobacteriota bacterium]